MPYNTLPNRRNLEKNAFWNILVKFTLLMFLFQVQQKEIFLKYKYIIIML